MISSAAATSSTRSAARLSGRTEAVRRDVGEPAGGASRLLAASFCYQDQLFNQEIRELNAAGLLAWRQRFRERFDQIATRYPPRTEIDLVALADMAATLVEGGLILGRALRDVPCCPSRSCSNRDFVRTVFLPG